MPAVVVAVSCVAFLPALDGLFLDWDDDVNFVENDRYRGLGPSELRWMFTTTLLGHYIPLTWMSFGLNFVLGGMHPWGYHLGNLLLHAANAGLFYLVARRLLGTAAAGGVAGADPARRPDLGLLLGAAFAALAWGVHPLRVESVAWITERRDVLCTLFYLLAGLAYLRGVARGGVIAGPWRWLSLGAFALSLLSKAAAMPLPAVLLLLDVYPLRRAAARGWRRLLLEKAPYALLAAGAAVMAAAAQWAAGAVTDYGRYGAGARLGMTAYSLVFYPWKLAWPADLSPLYELPSRVDPLAGRFLLALIAFAGVTAVLVLARRRCPGALAAWIYSALLVLPVTGAVVHAGVQLVSDRYTYLSSLGFATLAGGALVWLLRAGSRLRPSVVAAGVLAAALVVGSWAAASWRQSHVWLDSETLWRRAVEVEPDCAVCNVNLGAVLVGRPSGDPRRPQEAEALFRHAIAWQPDRHFAYHGLGVALALQRRYDEAETAFREYVRRDPASPVGPADLGLLRLAQRRFDEAIPFLRRALAMDPRSPLSPDLARALRERAEELRREGRGPEADRLTTEAEALGIRPAPSGRGRVTTTAR